MTTDQRLIEDYIPIEAISAEARKEKSIRKGHISTLHLWWARRPLVAARAAVYGVLVPAPADKKAADEAEQFVTGLCKYPGEPGVIAEARRHILEAHAARLTAEGIERGLAPAQAQVTVEDIEAGRAPRPRVLDMFAGGGAIPLEALRLGCEAYALDLNPVAHLIELCTLVYPQQFGAADPSAKGSAADGTWAGLAAEVEYWGKWVLERVQAEIGDLYPPIPDPRQTNNQASKPRQLSMGLVVSESLASYHTRATMLTPIAYLWTRTVCCKNPACGATVPLARQTWLEQKASRQVAVRADIETNRENDGAEKKVRYRVIETATAEDLGFDPTAGSKGGNVACPFCGTVADTAYVKVEGQTGRIGVQLMTVVCTLPGEQGKVYLAPDEVPPATWPDIAAIQQRIHKIEADMADDSLGPLTVPDEPIVTDAKGSAWVIQYGIGKFGGLFTERQLLSLMSFAKWIRLAYRQMLSDGYRSDGARGISAYLAIALDRLADFNSVLCVWKETAGHTFARQALPMVWDFSEVNPFSGQTGSWGTHFDYILAVVKSNVSSGKPAKCYRGSATQMPFEDATLDAIITDPPYYDNVAYADLSDFFYVWLKRSIGPLYPEHFASLLTPKKGEAVADATRHKGDHQRAARVYEQMMAQAFVEAGRVLKPGGPLIIVYAHKTTQGWSTLVDALRTAGFMVTEAWPLDTEMTTRVRAMETASLASSIFLVARRRGRDEVGSYEYQVRPNLHTIVRERLNRLWGQGVTGADLVIACLGAGLSAFTRYARVEYANGATVPADSFLAEVEGEVLEALLEKLFGVSQAGMGSVDPITRFYVLWRYAYRSAAVSAGEAIVFTYPQHVELDGSTGLTAGRNPLVEKQKSAYRLRDFTERGEDDTLGIPKAAEHLPLVDVLHRLLWLVENRPALIPAYLDEARPDVERLRIVAQTLAGQALAGNDSGGGKSLVAARGAEAATLRKLTTNWRTLIEAHRGPLA